VKADKLECRSPSTQNVLTQTKQIKHCNKFTDPSTSPFSLVYLMTFLNSHWKNNCKQRLLMEVVLDCSRICLDYWKPRTTPPGQTIPGPTISAL